MRSFFKHKIKAGLLFLFCISALGGNKTKLFADTPDLYESRKSQIQFLMNQTVNPDSLAFILLEEAAIFAGEKAYLPAIDLLDEVLLLLNSNMRISTEAPISQNSMEDIFQIFLESGVDYSRQEYEMSFLENDSVVVEELNNPYLNLRLQKSGVLLKNQFQLYGYLRGDKQSTQSNANLILESNTPDLAWRLSTESSLYFHKEQNFGDFFENRFYGYFSKNLVSNLRFSTTSNFRFKDYFSADSAFGNILSADISTNIRKYMGLMSWLEIGITPSLFKENQYLGHQFWQIQSFLNLELRKSFNQYLTLRGQYYFKNFESQSAAVISTNQYHRVHPEITFELPVSKKISFYNRFQFEIRDYAAPDQSNSDFTNLQSNPGIKYYFGNYNFISIGYIFQRETHRTTVTDDRPIVEQENFSAYGYSVGIDLMQTSGLFFSLNYQFTLRDYPNGGTEDLYGFYSNRRINNIQALGFIPLSNQIQINLLANYDNDRDRDREANDTFNTIFSLGISYKF